MLQPSFPTPAPSATGCVGWCFPRRPAALGPARGACSCGPLPTPSAPGAWPQPQRRFFSFSHPTCKYCRTSTPAPLSLRAPVVVCLLCRSSQIFTFRSIVRSKLLNGSKISVLKVLNEPTPGKPIRKTLKKKWRSLKIDLTQKSKAKTRRRGR